jgi:hypothetical protein
MQKDSSLVPIPGLGHQDTAIVQSLLAHAGFFYRVHDGFGECPDVVLIREADLAAVKELLREYRIRSPRDKRIPIQW